MLRQLTSYLMLGMFLSLAGSVHAAGPHSFSAGARKHVAHTEFSLVPFDKEDYSYGLAYEYTENLAYWQLGLLYTPGLELVPSVDYVLSPEINLIWKDNAWRGGAGILASYVKDEFEGGDWTSIYWQFLLGISLPIVGLPIDISASYVFEDWGGLSDFSTRDLEWVAWIKLPF